MKLLNTNRVSIQISDRFIFILIGNKNKIKYSDTIELKEGMCENGVIIDEQSVARYIGEYFQRNRIKNKTISFVISESHIISRCIELPKLKEEILREEVYFELNEFIPNIEDYYIDYEILKNSKKENRLKILLVATTKEKVDSLVNLSQKINMKLDAIDIISNSFKRVFQYVKLMDYFESIGVFYIGFNSSTFSVVESGILKFERTIPFGINNLIKEYNCENNVSLKGISIEELVEGSERGTLSFNNLITSTSKTIQFYNSERKNSKIEKIIIISPMRLGKIIEEQILKSFNISIIIVKDPSDLGLKIKCDDFANYVGNYGLFLRS